MKIKQRFDKILENELYYSILCLILVSGFLLFGILYFIPRFGIYVFFILQVFLTIAAILYFYIRYGTLKSKIAIEEKYYTMQIRRLNDQKLNGYIDEDQYNERIKEFEKKLKK
jgi:uncharacterized membrane protein